MKFEFVVTPELRETIADFKEMGKIMKNPKNWLEGIGMFLCFVMIFFGLILIG